MSNQDLILHICPREAWEAAVESGEYKAPSLSSEGFIHCSHPEQVGRVANHLFTGVQGLILLHINAQFVLAEIRWEEVEGETFPHIYGPLNLDAVVDIEDFPPGEDGHFNYPDTGSTGNSI